MYLDKLDGHIYEKSIIFFTTVVKFQNIEYDVRLLNVYYVFEKKNNKKDRSKPLLVIVHQGVILSNTCINKDEIYSALTKQY